MNTKPRARIWQAKPERDKFMDMFRIFTRRPTKRLSILQRENALFLSVYHFVAGIFTIIAAAFFNIDIGTTPDFSPNWLSRAWPIWIMAAIFATTGRIRILRWAQPILLGLLSLAAFWSELNSLSGYLSFIMLLLILIEYRFYRYKAYIKIPLTILFVVFANIISLIHFPHNWFQSMGSSIIAVFLLIWLSYKARYLFVRPHKERVIVYVKSGDRPELDLAQTHQITARQSHVLELVKDGLSNKEIAQRLGISEDTVKKHFQDASARLKKSGRIAVMNFLNDHSVIWVHRA